MMISKQCLEMFQHNPDEFLCRFITVDEIWIHYFTSETKEQSKQCTSLGELPPKKAKTIKSAGKMMATIFWNARGIIHRLSSIEANDQWRLLRSLFEPFQQHFKKKTSPFERRKCSSIKTIHTCTDGQIQ